MPEAILAIRSYPATLLLALLLFLATLVITTGSLGKVGSGGGDSGDGGSGIGGTGRSGEFGGSGFGGTGGSSPFFTSAEEEDHTVEPGVLEYVEPTAIESPTELANLEAQERATQAIEESLTETIKQVLEQHPLINESHISLASDSGEISEALRTAPSPIPETALSSQQIVEVVQLESSEESGVDPISTHDIQYSTLEEDPVDVYSNPNSELLQNVAETVPVNLDVAPQLVDPEIDRSSLPDRIQRPELPPFQRIRPVERAAIMPPRVQPMRI